MAIHGCKNSSVLYISRYQAYSGIYSAKIFDGLVARLKSHEDVENVEIDLLATHQLSSKEEAMARPLAKYKALQANFCGLRQTHQRLWRDSRRHPLHAQQQGSSDVATP